MTDRDRYEQALELIATACKIMGWEVLVPNSEYTSYVIMGTKETVKTLEDRLERSVN